MRYFFGLITFLFCSLNIIAVNIDNTGVNRDYSKDVTQQRFIDLEAVSLSGNSLIGITTQQNYTVRIKNNSTTTQSNYYIKLIVNELGVATVNGPQIQPLEIIDVVIPWTPYIGGQIQLTGKVIILGDEVSSNDTTPPLSVNIEAYGSVVVNIGSGNQNSNNCPVNMSAQNSLFEYLILQDEIGYAGLLTNLTFFNNFQTHLPDKPTKIWLGTTTATDLSAGWIPMSEMTIVFDGIVSYPFGQNYINIPFTAPYVYSGNNLVVLIQRPFDNISYSPNDVFQCQTIGTDRALSYSSNNVVIDPAAPPAGVLCNQFPKTILSTIVFSPPSIYVFPSTCDYGIVPPNSYLDKTFFVVNLGGGTVSVTNISVSGSPFFSLQNLPTLPISLSGFQTTTLTARYNPSVTGTHSATVIITHNLGNTQIALSGVCGNSLINNLPYTENFNSVIAPDIPIYWRNIHSSTSYCLTNNINAHSVPNCIEMNNAGSTTENIMLISPPLATSIPMNSVKVSFWARGQTGYTLKLGVMTNPLETTTFTEVSNITLSSAWIQYTVVLSSYTGQGQYITFKHGLQTPNRIICIDDITFEQIQQNDLAAISVTGFLAHEVNTLTTNYVMVQNTGYSSPAIYSVKLYREGDIELGSIAGTLLNPNETATYSFSWTPTSSGNTYLYGKVILDGDTNNLNNMTSQCNILVTPTHNHSLPWIGAGNLSSIYAPMTMYYRTSLFETIYPSAELNFMGCISGVQFINNFQISQTVNKPVKIWLGTTTQNSLDSGFISAAQMTLVYDGLVSFPNGINIVEIIFTTPFVYLQDNLVMMVQRPFDTHNFSSTEQFICQTDANNRAIRAVSDVSQFNPVSPPLGTPTGLFPKTRFIYPQPSLAGIQGTVYDSNNLPISNATVQIPNGPSTTTNPLGEYHLQNLIEGVHQLSVTAFGYVTQTAAIMVDYDEITTHDFIMAPMPTINVYGIVTGSDAPTTGISGANVYLNGYGSFSTITDAMGAFIITVYTNQTYQYTITALGYSTTTGSVITGTTDYVMGTITLNEITYPPANVQAVFNYPHLTLTWTIPDPNAANINQSFETDDVPPPNWTRMVTNNGPANTSGVYPTWCRFGSATVVGQAVNPPDGVWQCGLWWDYNHQDEWLITPPIVCPINGFLSFWTYVFRGSVNGDHYYVKASINNGLSWDTLWDASLLTGGWNNYQTPVVLDLSVYGGQEIKIAWHAKDSSTTNDGLWYPWFIDDIQIGNNQAMQCIPMDSFTTKSAQQKDNTYRIDSSGRQSRANDIISLTNASSYKRNGEKIANTTDNRFPDYKIWRLNTGQENSEHLWTLLTPSPIEALSFSDVSFINMPWGSYKWAVRAVYPNNVYSVPGFSNSIIYGNPNIGHLTGVVTDINNVPISGATITINTFSATTNANGIYNLSIWSGTYAVTCTATGYEPQTIENVIINGNGEQTELNFMMNTHSSNNTHNLVTKLEGNYPNPFATNTTINYSVKGILPVKIEIFNTRGQLIRTFIDDKQTTEQHSVVWDGNDFRGKAVAGGVYYCRMQSGKYVSTKRMLLLK